MTHRHTLLVALLLGSGSAGAGLLAGCDSRRVPDDAGPTRIDAPDTPHSKVVTFYPEELGTKLDLLFVIDNSSSMEQKQQSLGWAFPRLLEALRLPSRKSFHHRLPPRVMIAATRPAQEDFFSPISDRTTVAFG